MRAGIVFCFLIILASPVQAGQCLQDGTHVTISGKIKIVAVPADPDNGTTAYKYPLLSLNRPICLNDMMGNADIEQVVALVESTVSRTDRFTTGEHVIVSGRIVQTDNGNQPPQDFMLMLDAPSP